MSREPVSRKYIVLTEGHSEPHAAKTACSVIRYRTSEVLAVLDSQQRGRTTQEVLSVGGGIPFVDSLAAAPEANTLLIGIAPVGGKIPATWRAIVLQAIERGMDIVSGLHDFLADDPEFAAAAARQGVKLIYVRRNRERQVAQQVGLRDDCLRIHTVGHDCSVGKMVAAIEVTNELKRRGRDAKFLASGQTGIMVEGDGVPVDCVVADFVSGAIEQLVLRHQHHEILLIEGQGSLVHPAYSGVTLGLLHGCAPHGLILCYEIGRETITGVPGMRIPPLSEIRRLNEVMANVMRPCRVIGIGMNSRLVSAAEAAAERERVRADLQLPVCDVFRDGPQELADAVLKLREEVSS
jgi:uncharacterized NAD-dependent epimerase/dehydratase family protein